MSFVYFIQCVSGGPIKIGYAVDPVRRVSHLQSGTFEELKILASIPGSRQQEAALHRKFAAARVRSEWFSPTASLLSLIAEVKTSGKLEIDSLVVPRPVNQTTSPLLALIDAFCMRHSMSASAFGKSALGDPNFVRDIRVAGRRLHQETADKVRAFMSASFSNEATP